MRTLNIQEVTEVSGGQAQVVVDVNVPGKYVSVNVVDGTKVTVLVKIDWSKWFKAPTTAVA